MNLNDLAIKTRTLSLLKDGGYISIEQVRACPDDELLNIPGFTPSALTDLKECLYCYDCCKSSFHLKTCKDNVLHCGRFIGAAAGLSCNSKEMVSLAPKNCDSPVITPRHSFLGRRKNLFHFLFL